MIARFYTVIGALVTTAVVAGYHEHFGTSCVLLLGAFAAWVCLQAYYAEVGDRSSWLRPRRLDAAWEYRYSLNPSEPTIYIRNICSFGSWKLDWHVIVGPDALDCFHSHPSTAWRFIVFGGYVEELLTAGGRRLVRWPMLKFGRVLPTTVHRVDAVYGRSYSLWLRGPKTRDTQLIGEGWARR